MSLIQEQVRLPFSVAFEVVIQGLRIRLGRSVVTLTGIVLGVAFLMSILSANLIRAGVAEEAAARQDTTRMMGFLTAETGPLSGRAIAVIAGGPLQDAEVRLLRAIESQRVGEIRWLATDGGDHLPPRMRTAVAVQTEDAAGDNASGVLLLGTAAPDPAMVSAVLANTRQPVLATVQTLEQPPTEQLLYLSRQPDEEELRRMEQEEIRNRARSIWIISIALMVTVICIANSLLMSVTERFKEIGTMKCLGALSSFIRRMYFIESSLLGLIGSVIGAIVGLLFAYVMYGITYGFGMSLGALSPLPTLLLFFLSIIGGLIASILAAIYPANFASRMVPATALRSNI